MATRRKKIKPAIKQRLVTEAGEKCANPGCANWQTHIHHIREWAIYQTDNEEEMIAVCPACHDAIHHGTLSISDETVYQWKKSHPTTILQTAHIYIEPNTELKLLTGSIAISTMNGKAIVFELSINNQLSFSIIDNDIMLVNLMIRDQKGKDVIRVVNNYVRSKKDTEIEFKHVPGKVTITAPINKRFVPSWIIHNLKEFGISLGNRDKMTILGLEVIKPGLIRVEGLWVEKDHAVAITKEWLVFTTPFRTLPIKGYGEKSTLQWSGPITTAMFDFG